MATMNSVNDEEHFVSRNDDYIRTELHPCSLETSQTPVGGSSGVACWPAVVSCYQLQDDGTRNGCMYLHLIKTNDDGRYLFDNNPQKVDHPSTGVLDGKWFSRQRPTTHDVPWLFATARSSGDLCLHSFQENEEGSFRLRHITNSLPLEDPKGAAQPLCLALNWSPEVDSSKIVSSYSNGYVAIHEVMLNEAGACELVQREAWFAHSLFGSAAAEVWSTCFAANGRLVLSGGDDAKIKFWDFRKGLSRPIQSFSDHFDAGVTVLSPHPRTENLVAAGSYDETVRLYDVRYDGQKPLYKSESLGGGIWRLSWHPCNDNRFIVAAMHGGCRAVTMAGNNGPFSTDAKFTTHESMVYGADWLVQRSDNQGASGLDAAASCSFYDRSTFIWRVGSEDPECKP